MTSTSNPIAPTAQHIQPIGIIIWLLIVAVMLLAFVGGLSFAVMTLWRWVHRTSEHDTGETH